MLPAKTRRTEQAASDAERFRQIVNAAAQAFALAGYHRTQMADIAAGAKVALGSIYRHAESKEELFASAMALGVGLDPSAVIGERPIGDIENVLDSDRDAMQWPANLAAVQFLAQGERRLTRAALVHQHPGLHLWLKLLDSGQTALHQIDRP